MWGAVWRETAYLLWRLRKGRGIWLDGTWFTCWLGLSVSPEEASWRRGSSCWDACSVRHLVAQLDGNG